MSVRRSLGIVTLTRAVVFVLSVTTVVVVSRLLTPAEIGIFSVSVAVIGFGHLFRDFGVGQYLMQVHEVTREKRRAAFTVTLAFSWCMSLVLYVASPYAGTFYRNQGVAEVLLLLTVNFILLPFGAPLRTLLQRNMQFGKLAVVNLSNHVVQSCTTVAAAFAGASYMSMAWGSIAGNLANVLVLLLISPKGALDWPTSHGLGEVLRFGSKSSVASLATEAGGAAPDLILGRTLGFSDVAFYSRANGLVSMALGQLMYVVQSVYAPVFAKGFREGKDTAAVYAQTAGLLLGLTLPIIALMAMLAPYLITFMFGAHWARSAMLASMICIFAMIKAPFALAATSLIATGHVGMLMRFRLVTEALRILVLLVSIVQTLEVVVAALGLVYVVEAVLFMLALRSSVGLRLPTLWSQIYRSYALVPIVLLGPAVLLGITFVFGSISDFWMLAVASLLALLGWLVGIVLLKHPLEAEVRTILRFMGEWGRTRFKRVGR